GGGPNDRPGADEPAHAPGSHASRANRHSTRDARARAAWLGPETIASAAPSRAARESRARERPFDPTDCELRPPTIRAREWTRPAGDGTSRSARFDKRHSWPKCPATARTALARGRRSSMRNPALRSQPWVARADDRSAVADPPQRSPLQRLPLQGQPLPRRS